MYKFLFLIAIFIFPEFVSAQAATENIESHQVTKIGDNLVLSGFKRNTDLHDFVAILYNKDLKEIARYEKKIDVAVKSYYAGKSGDLTVFTFYVNVNSERYRIALDANFKEVFASAPSEASKKAKDTDTTIVGAEWTYEPGYNNYYFMGDLMIESQLYSITGYSLTDPVQGNYREKWEKDFSGERYAKMNFIKVEGRTAYYYAVKFVPEQVERLIAIDIDNGNIIFSNSLTASDTLDAVCISNIFLKGNVLYLGGTYILHEEDIYFHPQEFPDASYQTRGYDTRNDFFLAEADGYFVMTIDEKTGTILKMKTFDFPSIDKTVDMRDFRMAICQGIAPLANGKMVAFFEMVSTAKDKADQEGPNIGPMSGRGKRMETDPKQTLKWQTDAFASVIFTQDFSDFTINNFIWDEDSQEYGLSEYDIFTLKPNSDMPHDFYTLDDEGCYVQNFMCNGKDWVFNVHSDDTDLADFLIRCNETETKTTKLLSPGLLYMFDTNKGYQLKDLGGPVQLQILTW